MQDLAARFLTDADRAQVIAAVREAEQTTSGEIVPLVVAASHTYPQADWVGALSLALPLALAGTPLIGGSLWLGSQNLWVFLGLFAVLFFLAQVLVGRWPALKRCFISDHDVAAEVQEGAVTAFFRHGLYRTRAGTGVLIYVSVLERKVWILADRGIDSRVPPGTWDEIVRDLTAGIRGGRRGDALSEAVRRVGAVLAEHFPVAPDDRDELENLIVES